MKAGDRLPEIEISASVDTEPTASLSEKSSLTMERAAQVPPIPTGRKEGSKRSPRRSKTADPSFQTPRHPWEDRKTLRENYVGEVSGREGWWRSYIRETPLPGAYENQTFLEEFLRRPNTYRFKSDGRKIDSWPPGKGTLLLPGAYSHEDFLHRLEKSSATYNFKATDRSKGDSLNFGRKDKDANVSPNAYATEKHLTMTAEKSGSKHSMFKSQSRRFPTASFKPREGPAPGSYGYNPPRPLHGVSAPFKSGTPRFHSSHTKVPGPGAYEKMMQHPMPATVQKMGRQYSLFFSSAFQA